MYRDERCTYWCDTCFTEHHVSHGCNKFLVVFLKLQGTVLYESGILTLNQREFLVVFWLTATYEFLGKLVVCMHKCKHPLYCAIEMFFSMPISFKTVLEIHLTANIFLWFGH